MKKIIVMLSLLLSLTGVLAPGIKAYAAESNDMIEYGTIIKEESKISLNSNEYTIEKIQPSVSTQSYGNNTSTDNNYVEPLKVENEAGLSYINFNNETKYVEYNDSGKVKETSVEEVSTNTLATGNDYFVIENGIVTEASEANIITLGGAEKINYIYPTLEDAKNTTNGVTISGGAETGSYYETITYEGEEYVKITISGYEGYMNLKDVQIVPSYVDMNTSYYFAQDEVWYKASAIDPIASDEYMVMPISDAPSWAEENVRYYSDDAENFTVDEYMAPETYTDYQNTSYFQNLSLRSTTNYTGTELKSYLTYLGKTSSEYYNSTQAFIDAQNLYGINGLLLFAMANLESAYGTSTYAKQCYNFFGRGAYDSNPDNACAGRQFGSAWDGIMAQAIFLSQGYLDQADWRYEGSYVGSKSGGLNAHYASDGEWGQKIASIAYSADQYLGNKDNNYYRVVQINGDVPVYTSSSMTTKVRAQGAYMCNEAQTKCIDQDNPNSYVDYYIGRQTSAPVRVIVTGETSNAYEIQVETGQNTNSSGFVSWTNAETGSHPNYEGHNHGKEGQSDENYVSKGYLNFANDYDSFTANQFWIPKTYNGNATTTLVANNSIKSPKDDVKLETTYTYYSDGDVKTKTEKYTDVKSNQVIQKTVYTYDNSTGKLVDYVNECFNLKGKRTYYNHSMYQPDGSITYKNVTDYDNSGIKLSYDQYWYNSSGSLIEKYERQYSSNGVEIDYVHKIITSGKQTYYRHVTRNSSNVKTYDHTMKYTSSGLKTSDNTYNYYDNGILNQSIEIAYYNGIEIDYLNQCFNSKGARTYYRHNMYENDGSVSYENITDYDNNGVKMKYNQYYYDKNGKLVEKFERKYSKGKEVEYIHQMLVNSKQTYFRHIDHYSNGKVSYDHKMEYTGNGTKVSDDTYYYYENGKKQQTIEKQYKNGIEIDYVNNCYYSSGVKSYYRHVQHNTNNKVTYDRTVKYDANGNKYYDKTI